MKADTSFPPVEAFKEPMLCWYKNRPDLYELDKLRVEEIMPKKRKDQEAYGEYYTLINAWSDSWSTRETITEPPEVSDFKIGGRRKLGDPMPFKSPAHAARLIKKVAHHFGATMVGITTIEPDWCYNYNLRGSEERGTYEVPKHWKYVIAFGVPHQWEQVNFNPNSGTSFDAYSRASIAITPETGSNFRAAFVTTSLEMEIDQPIDFGVQAFCEHCQICADICPSGSISKADSNEGMNTRGYSHWEINQTSCYNFWLHSMARKIDSKDPTGLVDNGLTYMQKNLFEAPEAHEYLPPPDGSFANFREPPEWLQVKNYLDIDVINPSIGN